jgi:catechol 2,3-dioxygenase-like lactoylglutathione lyase family enzyme
VNRLAIRLAGALALLVSAGLALAQPAAPSQPAAPAQPPAAPAGPAPTGLTVGSGNYFSPIVADLDKAIAFYKAVGFEFTGEPANADKNPQLRAMFGLPDARLRYQVGRALPYPGGVEIIEVSKAGGEPVVRRIQDAGAVTLVATVRDLDTTFARVKQLGAPIVTRSGKPLDVGAPGRMVIVKDPDGHFVELVQPAKLTEAQAAAKGNVVGVRVRMTVDNLEASLKLYRDALGFHEIAPMGTFGGTKPVLDVLGLKDGQYRVGQLQIPTTGLQFTLIDFKGVDRQKKVAGVEDPGSTRIQLRVADIDKTVAALTQAGGEFVSTGGKPLDLPAGQGSIKVGIVRDPDNMFLVLINAPPAAPR